jgi:hypothetical protein
MMLMSSRNQYWDFKVRSFSESADDKKGRRAFILRARNSLSRESLTAKLASNADHFNCLKRDLFSYQLRLAWMFRWYLTVIRHDPILFSVR